MICPDCGFKNDEDRLFCGACGEPLKGDAKLIRDAEKLKAKKEAEAEAAKVEVKKDVPLKGRTSAADEHYEFKRHTPKKTDYTEVFLIGVAMIAFIVLCGCGWYALKYFV